MEKFQSKAKDMIKDQIGAIEDARNRWIPFVQALLDCDAIVHLWQFKNFRKGVQMVVNVTEDLLFREHYPHKGPLEGLIIDYLTDAPGEKDTAESVGYLQKALAIVADEEFRRYGYDEDEIKRLSEDLALFARVAEAISTYTTEEDELNKGAVKILDENYGQRSRQKSTI